MAATPALVAWVGASPNALPGSDLACAELRCGLVGLSGLAGWACRRAPVQGGEPSGAGPCQGTGPCKNLTSLDYLIEESERRLSRRSTYASCRTVSKNYICFLVSPAYRVTHGL